MQVDDRGPGKKKGFVDSLPPGQELQADRGRALNPDPNDDIVTRALPPGLELQADRGRTFNLETIHSDLDGIVTRALTPGLELQADRGSTLDLDTINSDLDDTVTRGLPLGLELQADPGGALNPDTIHSDLDGVAAKGLPASLEVNFIRGKSLPASQAKVAPRTIVPDTDETPATALSHPWELGDDRAKVLHSTNLELEDDDEGNLRWKLVPYFGAALFIVSWIVKSDSPRESVKGLELGSVNGPREFPLEDQFEHAGARSSALDKIAAAFSTAGEQRQKAVDQKRGASLQHFSGDPDIEKARAQSDEHTQEIEQTFPKAFDGIGLG